jgi:ABC-type ATPase involved in cell division
MEMEFDEIGLADVEDELQVIIKSMDYVVDHSEEGLSSLLRVIKERLEMTEQMVGYLWRNEVQNETVSPNNKS